MLQCIATVSCRIVRTAGVELELGYQGSAASDDATLWYLSVIEKILVRREGGSDVGCTCVTACDAMISWAC